MRVGLAGLLFVFVLILLSNFGERETFDLQKRLPDFERSVALQRMRIDPSAKVKMVVFEKDHSSFVTANNFELVVYDEADDIAQDLTKLSGFWPTPTGVTDVGFGRKSVERISGHYYHVRIANP